MTSIFKLASTGLALLAISFATGCDQESFEEDNQEVEQMVPAEEAPPTGTTATEDRSTGMTTPEPMPSETPQSPGTQSADEAPTVDPEPIAPSATDDSQSQEPSDQESEPTESPDAEAQESENEDEESPTDV